jgi:hypothetical protein
MHDRTFDEPLTWHADRNIARSLGVWELLDMGLVDRKGAMAIGGAMPAGKTGQLIEKAILKREKRADGWVLVKGPRFDRVKLALIDIQDARQRAAEAML